MPRITASPATWLAVSLISLKWSRSTYASAIGGAARTFSSNATRFSSPVDGSMLARSRIVSAVTRCWCIANASIIGSADTTIRNASRLTPSRGADGAG